MEISLSRRLIAQQVLGLMADAQLCGRNASLDELTERLGIRRSDIRRTLSDLHREGHVDVLRMRLTLSGFTLGCANVGRVAKRGEARGSFAA